MSAEVIALLVGMIVGAAATVCLIGIIYVEHKDRKLKKKYGL